MEGGGPGDVLLDDQVGELGRAHVEAVGGRRPAALDGVAVAVAQGHEAVVAGHVGEVEARHPLDGGQRGVAGPTQAARPGPPPLPGPAPGRSRRPGR